MFAEYRETEENILVTVRNLNRNPVKLFVSDEHLGEKFRKLYGKHWWVEEAYISPRGGAYNYWTKMSPPNYVERSHLLLGRTAEQGQLRDICAVVRSMLETEKKAFLALLFKEAELKEPAEEIHVCRDPKDDKYLELAVSGDADFIISGDKDLLDLHPFRETSILTPEQFLTLDLE